MGTASRAIASAKALAPHAGDAVRPAASSRFGRLGEPLIMF